MANRDVEQDLSIYLQHVKIEEGFRNMKNLLAWKN